MKSVFLAMAASLSMALTACSNHDGKANDEVEAVEVATSNVAINDAYIMPPFKGRDIAAGFFVASNSGAADRLVTAATPIAETVEIHTHSEVDGVMAMRKIDGVDLPEGASVEFRPGSYHLMMFGVELTDDVTETPLTLTFESGQSQTLTVPIRR